VFGVQYEIVFEQNMLCFILKVLIGFDIQSLKKNPYFADTAQQRFTNSVVDT
jgi:hypothetical protein